MVSFIIPARNEPFLYKTVEDILAKCEGDFEVIVVLDGVWAELPQDPRVRHIFNEQPRGMRGGINQAAAIAQGDYLLKLDAHCMIDQGFDVKLLADIEDNWVVVPRRKRLDAENWCIQDVGKVDIDYEYVTNPAHDDMHGAKWDERSVARKHILIDDCPTFQGSCWFMKKSYFYELELMDEATYGTFYNEAQEICFKAWLSGGRVKVNKKTWYAHLHKGKKYGRGYALGGNQRPIASAAMRQWVEGKGWHKQTLPFSYLLEIFPDMPTWTS